MWKSIKINDNNYIFKKESGENCLRLSLSDLKCIWSEKLQSDEILSRFKEINPVFESNQNIKDRVSSVFDNIEEALEVQAQPKDDLIVLTLRSHLEKIYTFGFKFVLKKLPVDDFFSEVTVPMIRTILKLEEEKRYLCDVIKKKDRELLEYKYEKGEISRGDLKTEPFHCADENAKHENLMLNLFKPSFFPQNISVDFQPELDSKRQDDDSIKSRPLRRKIYSAKTLVKKHYY